MSDLVFAFIAYLLLLPVLILVPVKLAFKHKVLISSGALLLTILSLLANSVIPLYQVMIIFTLLLLLSTYFLETRLRPLFLHTLKTSENHITSKSNGTSRQEIDEDPPTEVRDVVDKDGYRNDPTLHTVSLENMVEDNINVMVNQEYIEVPPSPGNKGEDDWEDLEKQLQEWNPPSKEKDSMQDNPILSSTLSREEEEEYNRLFFETKN